MEQNIPNNLRLLHDIYTNSNSPIYLEKNLDRVLQFTKQNPNLYHLTKRDILEYQRHLSALSRSREVRILRNRRRYLAHRPWRVFAPLQICMYTLILSYS